MRFHGDTQRILISAARIARDLGHGYVGSAHLLMAMARQPDFAGDLLRWAGVEPEGAAQMAGLLYGKGTPGLPLPQGYSGQMRRILREAGREADYQKSSRVEPVHILLSLLRQDRTAAKELLILRLKGVQRVLSP